MLENHTHVTPALRLFSFLMRHFSSRQMHCRHDHIVHLYSSMRIHLSTTTPILIDRARRLGYCAQNLQNFDELCDAADDELFSKVAQLPNHVLHQLLPPLSTASQQYNLRHRTHSLQLPQHNTYLLIVAF